MEFNYTSFPTIDTVELRKEIHISSGTSSGGGPKRTTLFTINLNPDIPELKKNKTFRSFIKARRYAEKVAKEFGVGIDDYTRGECYSRDAGELDLSMKDSLHRRKVAPKEPELSEAMKERVKYISAREGNSGQSVLIFAPLIQSDPGPLWILVAAELLLAMGIAAFAYNCVESSVNMGAIVGLFICILLFAGCTKILIRGLSEYRMVIDEQLISFQKKTLGLASKRKMKIAEFEELHLVEKGSERGSLLAISDKKEITFGFGNKVDDLKFAEKMIHYLIY